MWPAFSFILELPDEVLLYLFCSLECATLLTIRQTCKRLCLISRSKQVWVNVYIDEIVGRHLPWPPYFKPIDALMAKELEASILHSIKLDHRMAREMSPRVIPFNQIRSVTWVRLIHAEWLLVASSDSVSSSIALWSVSSLLSSGDGKTVQPVSEAFLPAPVSNGAVDTDANTITFAAELRGSVPRMDIMTIVDLDGSPRVCRVECFEGVAQLRFIRGGLIGLSLYNNTNLPCVLRWKECIIECLRATPDLQGGAIAMHMQDEWLAVVRRSVLEIYVVSARRSDGSCFNFWGSVDLVHGVGSASFSLFTPPSMSAQKEPSLRLCITCVDGLFVYDVLCDLSTQVLALPLLWHHKPDRTECLIRDASQGMLGLTGGTVSCIVGGRTDPEEPLKFATTKLPQVYSDETITVFEWYDDGMPVQYCLGVRDYDEARGIAIFGNAFGELSLYEFSGSAQSSYQACTRKLDFPKYTDEQLLPTEEILSVPYPPFPYAGSVLGTETEKSVYEFWRSRRPAVVPPGWSADFESKEWLLLFSGQARVEPWYSWGLENASHYYGRPIPLLHGSVDWWDVAIIDVGGLLFLWWNEEQKFIIIHPGLTCNQVVHYLDSDHRYLYQASFVQPDETQSLRGSRFHETWLWEVTITGRNRWKELHERGGRVHIDLLDINNLPEEGYGPM